MRTFSLLLFLFLSLHVHAQDSLHSPNSVFAEAGGSGGIYSIGYEKNMRLAAIPFNMDLALEIVPLGHRTVITLPVSLNYSLGKGAHKLELGTGQMFTLSIGGGKGGTIRGTVRVGYRLEPTGKHYYLRFAYTPFYSWIYNFQWNHWAGISYGFYFK